jgi:hypothetical protein
MYGVSLISIARCDRVADLVGKDKDPRLEPE